MKLAAFFATVIVATTSASVARAQTAPVATLIDRIDTDGDGIFSRDEIAAVRERLFARLDLDGDGNLEAREVEELRDAIMDRAVAVQARLARQSRRMDANGDSTVSAEEFRTRTLLFDLADRDGDGRLSPAEFAVIRSVLIGRAG
jgi:uncharacterized protein YhaN